MLQPCGWMKTFCLPTADGVTKAGLYGIKLTFGKDALPNKSATKLNVEFKVLKSDGCSKRFCLPTADGHAGVPHYFKVRRLSLVQMAICRFHRRGNAILFKVFDIGTSIYVLPCKPATKFSFRLKTW